MMRAVICRSGGETAYSDAPFEYAASHPEPALGGLHAAFPELPCPEANSVLLRVGFSSMNPADRGTDDHRTPKVMGSDVCGTVIAAGAGCTRLKVGDEVFGDIGANAAFAVEGETVTTKQLGAWGEVAEALETQLALKPSNLTQLEAGVLPKVALTSYKALSWHCGSVDWASAPTVLIIGCSSGCGTCAIQIAKALGAGAVHATCSGRNVEYCRGLGAQTVVDYTQVSACCCCCCWVVVVVVLLLLLLCFHSSHGCARLPAQESWAEVFGPDSLDVVYDCIGEPDAGDGAMATLRSGGAFVSIRGVASDPAKARDDVSQVRQPSLRVRSKAGWTYCRSPQFEAMTEVT